ncbi:MAG: DEAD/DEAH box helicase family protein, partial [Elusimicrobia bacterium]|nr:DEAD/DEAH box helicase family protein [Elusimicrobiota bacterium]
MELKKYQERVIREIKAFPEALAKEQARGNKHSAQDAWEEATAKASGLISVPEALRSGKVPWLYHPRKGGLGRDLPTFCVKVPTGGGKTLLATQILGLIHQTVLKNRNGCGLILWVVPSDQIYKDTLKHL